MLICDLHDSVLPSDEGYQVHKMNFRNIHIINIVIQAKFYFIIGRLAETGSTSEKSIYLKETRERGIVLRIGCEGICVRVFIDATYGIHADGKSHTGSVVVIGGVGPVHCRSGKQSIVSKSSTEAELIALSDSANQGIFLLG